MRKPSTGIPSVSRSSTVAGTSRRDFTPEETTSVRVRASAGDVGGDVGRRREPAVDSADPTGAEERNPDPVGDRERSADRRRADGALNRAGREVSRTDLARLLGEALELELPETHADDAVEHLIVAGTAPTSRTAASLARPTSTPSGAGNP